MDFSPFTRSDTPLKFTWNEVTGAVGDTVTVLPIVVAVAVLTDLSLAVMLIWFGVFQVVWGLYFGAPISVEPMKALAALILAGAVSTGEFLLAGFLLGGLLVLIGTTGTIHRLQHVLGSPVVRGIQLGVALVLLETGIGLGIDDPWAAGIALLVAIPLLVRGYHDVSAMVVLVVGASIALYSTGIPAPQVPDTSGFFLFTLGDLGYATLDATLVQLAMTLGNACLAASVLLNDYYNRDISPDQLATSMGSMNLIAVPLGAFPMCHGSGGIAGKYTFGARTAGSNIILGIGYVFIAIFALGVITAYPIAMLGVILAVIAFQLGYTSLNHARGYWLVISIGLIGLLINLGIALLVGVVLYVLQQRYFR